MGGMAKDNLLLSIPDNAVIIENSSWQTSPTATVWGCKNLELRRLRESVKLELTNINTQMKKKDLTEYVNNELNKLSIGTFTGQNNLGKILMLCRQALKNSTTPNIDYKLLAKYNIFLMNKQLF